MICVIDGTIGVGGIDGCILKDVLGTVPKLRGIAVVPRRVFGVRDARRADACQRVPAAGTVAGDTGIGTASGTEVDIPAVVRRMAPSQAPCAGTTGAPSATAEPSRA